MHSNPCTLQELLPHQVESFETELGDVQNKTSLVYALGAETIYEGQIAIAPNAWIPTAVDGNSQLFEYASGAIDIISTNVQWPSTDFSMLPRGETHFPTDLPIEGLFPNDIESHAFLSLLPSLVLDPPETSIQPSDDFRKIE